MVSIGSISVDVVPAHVVLPSSEISVREGLSLLMLRNASPSGWSGLGCG